MNEQPISFTCADADLVGILHRPAGPARSTGVVIVVGGGPQYRAGGHRQLVLWSRRMAESGYPVLRFDYRGMGDSGGEFPGFDHIDDDIRSAIDRLCTEQPELRDIVLWGECDGASAIMYYAYRDPRVRGVVLLNPWARTEALRARAVLKHYYLTRLLEPSFWRKLLTLRFNPLTSLQSIVETWRRSRTSVRSTDVASAVDLSAPLSRELPLPDRLLAGWRRFGGRIMLVMSGRDLIAREFDELIQGSQAWAAAIQESALTRHDLADGDHTFSSAAWRDQVIDWALHWLPAERGERGAA
jgi:uncharacterized protein